MSLPSGSVAGLMAVHRRGAEMEAWWEVRVGGNLEAGWSPIKLENIDDGSRSQSHAVKHIRLFKLIVTRFYYFRRCPSPSSSIYHTVPPRMHHATIAST